MTEKIFEQDSLAEFKNGSREAFESIFQENHKRVYSVALNFFGGNHELAEDITQQVFLKIFVKSGDFRGEANFTTWLYRITVNSCIDEQRKLRNLFSIERFFGHLKAKKLPDEKIHQREISDEVQKVVATLKPKFRLPILLKYVEGLSYQEIAEILNCSEGTVASRLNRGHKILVLKLQHLEGIL